MSHDKIGKQRIGDISRRSAPAAAVKSFEPNTRPFIHVCDRRSDFCLNDIFCQLGLVATRTLIPALRAKIITEFVDCPSTSTMIATENQTAVLMPHINRLEK